MARLRGLGFAVLLLSIPAAYVVSVRCSRRPGATADVSAAAASSFDAWEGAIDPATRLLVLGGGGEPDTTEAQLEADAELARETYAGPSLLLFGGGERRPGVRVLGAPAPDASITAELSTFFLGRDRDSTLRAPRIAIDAPATYENLMRALDALLVERGEPLTFVIATHGMQAEDVLDGSAVLWGNEGLYVRDLTDLLGQPSTARPVRLVVASCFGGAFGAIASIEPRGEEAVAMHCGVFATDAEHLASGCDPDPDRARHEGYLLHYLNALRGRNVAGVLEPSIDLDRDGQISMLEAHTRARIASRSFDVPSTSSEVFVRDAGDALELPWQMAEPERLPEETAVIEALGPALGIPNEAVAMAATATLEQTLAEDEEGLASAEALRDVAWNRLRVGLLERWPWIEDAYASGWQQRVEREREAIAEVLRRSPLAQAYREAEADALALAASVDELRIREARLRRLLRAYELPRKVAALRASDEARYRRFVALRACERYVPAVATTRRVRE